MGEVGSRGPHPLRETGGDRMKLLMLNERDVAHPLAGGVEVHLEEVASRLASRHAIETTVLCCGFPGAPSVEERRGIRFRRIGNRYSYYGLLPMQARAEAARLGPDLVVENLSRLLFFSRLFLPRVPRLGLVHQLFGLGAFRQLRFPLASWVVASEALLPLAYADCPFVAVSPSTREDLVRRGISPERIRVVLGGIDHDRYRPDPEVAVDPDLVVFLGRLEAHKGIDLLLDAWPAVRGARPGARLVIIGTGTAATRMRSRAASRRHGETVRFLGFVPDDEKVEWLRRAAVVVQPSHKEGFGLTVLEANACGTPVVASDVPGLRDSVRHDQTGLLVPVGDVVAFARALVRLLEDPVLRARLGSSGAAWSQAFSWDAVSDAVAEICRAAAARRPLPEAREYPPRTESTS